MSRDKKNLASLQVRKPKDIDAFIHGDDRETGATPKVPDVAPESGVTATPAPPIAVVEAAAEPAPRATPAESVEVSVQSYEATGVLYQRTDGETKRKRVAYLPLELDRELAAYCGANGRKVSGTIALFIREGLQKHAR